MISTINNAYLIPKNCFSLLQSTMFNKALLIKIKNKNNFIIYLHTRIFIKNNLINCALLI